MELAEIRPFEPQMAEIDLFTMPDAVGVGEPSVRKVKPYIAGHVTDGSSTFTFTVNGNDVTVSVSGGNWKYKPTDAITSLAFVGVPQLESLELNKITGLSTFNLDYPVVPVFKGCDATTEAALNYVYHIRGTATDDFQFTLRYIDDNNNQTTVTESAVVDENGKWDVAYSGKKIYQLGCFNSNAYITALEMTEDFNSISTLYTGLRLIDNVKTISLPNALFDNVTDIRYFISSNAALDTFSAPKATFAKAEKGTQAFTSNPNMTLFCLKSATFEKIEDCGNIFANNEKLATIYMPNATFDSVTNWGTSGNPLYKATAITDFVVPQSSTMPISFYAGGVLNLTYESMLRIAGWLKDLSGGTAQTVTFKAATYNALTAEQKAALTAIIVTEKGWNLATA